MAGTMARIAHDLALPLWYQPASALSYRWFRSTRWRHCSNGMPATSSISRSIMQSCLAYQHQLPQLQLWNSLQKPRPWRMKTLLGQVLNGWTRGNDTADGDSVFLRSRSSKRRRGPKRRSQRRRPAPLPQPGHDVLWKLRTAEQHRDDLIRAMSSVQFLWRRLFQRLQAAVSTSILRKGRPGHKSGISVRLRPVADVGAVDARVVLEKPNHLSMHSSDMDPSGVNMHRPANFSSTCRASTLDLGSYRPLGHWFEL